MIETGDGWWWMQVNDLAAARSAQQSFHACAENALSDFRIQVYNLRAGETTRTPTVIWPNHLAVVTGITGSVDVALPSHRFVLKPFSQVVVLPGVECSLTASVDSSLQILSFHAAQPALPPGSRK